VAASKCNIAVRVYLFQDLGCSNVGIADGIGDSHNRESVGGLADVSHSKLRFGSTINSNDRRLPLELISISFAVR
jgi:hypothetical protein